MLKSKPPSFQRKTCLTCTETLRPLHSARLCYYVLCHFVNCVYFCNCLYIHQVFHTRVLDLLLNFNAVYCRPLIGQGLRCRPLIGRRLPASVPSLSHLYNLSVVVYTSVTQDIVVTQLDMRDSHE